MALDLNAFAGDSLWDALVQSAGAVLGQSQLLYGTASPVIDPITGKTSYTFTDGQKEKELGSNYGFGDTAALNPFNKLNTLNRQQANDFYDQQNNSAAQGNLRSGGYEKRKGDLLWNQQSAQAGLKQEYLGNLGNLQQQALGAQNTYNSTLQGGWSDALQRKIANAPPGTVDPNTGATIAAPENQPLVVGEIGGAIGGPDPWTSLQSQYKGGKWDDGTNSDGSKFYRGTNGQLYRFYPDGRKIAVGRASSLGGKG